MTSEGSSQHDNLRPLEITSDDRVFVLTGAGISAESGIRTFRDSNGLWEEHRVEDVASPAGWHKDPEMVWRFYSQRRRQAATCEPNPAHRALADLEARIGSRLFLCTQNIDGLHERAGSTGVVHMHGELYRSRCEDPGCKSPHFEDHGLYESLADVPRCSCGERVRPHIVWFGEMPFFLDRIEEALAQCTLFVTVGSSGVVYPAAGFVRSIQQRRRGANVRSVYVGLEPPDNARSFDECRLGKAGEVLPHILAAR
jgi:NAD-dependent deacetylase